MHEWYVEYVGPAGNPVIEVIKGNDPDDVCHQLTQRYGTEWKLSECTRNQENG